MLVPAALTSQILDGIVDPGKGAPQSAWVGVEVSDANDVMAKVNVMNCSGAIFGSAYDAKKRMQESLNCKFIISVFINKCFTIIWKTKFVKDNAS